MASGIYVIENIENGKQYIGKSFNLEDRMWDSHKECTIIERAIEKYGDAIIRYVVQYCKPTKEELSYWEKYFIKEWNTMVPNGYNLTEGGDGGGIPSEETRKKMSLVRTGKLQSEESKKKKSIQMTGIPKSESARKKQGDSVRGDKNCKWGKKPNGSESKYFGVGFANRRYGYWQVTIGGKYVGKFKSEIEAAHAYNDYLIEHNITNRPFNIFPNE